jgi:hypothetical protein
VRVQFVDFWPLNELVNSHLRVLFLDTGAATSADDVGKATKMYCCRFFSEILRHIATPWPSFPAKWQLALNCLP